MLYLLDSSSLISVHDTYYSSDRVPEFWEWLHFQARKGVCKVPPSIYAEIKPTDEKFRNWIKRNKKHLVLAKEEKLELVRHVQDIGYGKYLTEVQIQKIGADPFLIASALEDPTYRLVVTHEVSKPSKKGDNRQIPDICDQVSVRWMSTVDFIRALDFKTGWRDEISQSELQRYTGPVERSIF